MERLGLVRILVIASIMSMALTAFHHVHEDLPAALRAPSSLLLTPIAVCSGLCHYLGIPLDVYGSTLLQFIANMLFFVPALLIGRLIVRRRKRSNT